MSDGVRRPDSSLTGIGKPSRVDGTKQRPLPTLVDRNQSEAEKPAHSVKMEWQNIRTAPFGCDLQLAVINAGGVHALAFPCRRILRGWVKAETNEPVYVRPTHWREWKESNSPLFVAILSLEKGSKL